MEWTPTNPVCTNLFFCLVDRDQLDGNTDFTTAGAITMDQLAYYNKLADDSINAAEAQALAMVLDSEFFAVYFVKYATGVTHEQAVNAFGKALVNTEYTLTDLAGVVAKNYVFSS